MAKKKQVAVEEQQEAVVVQTAEVKKPTVLTHYAFSMVDNENGTYSAVKIGFNPKEKFVSPVIEVIETNTDKFIIQERVGICVLDMEHSMI